MKPIILKRNLKLKDLKWDIPGTENPKLFTNLVRFVLSVWAVMAVLVTIGAYVLSKSLE